MKENNKQTITMGYMSNSTINQIINNYENKEIVDEYLKEKFQEINELFKKNDLDRIEDIIIKVDEKKEKLETCDELQLLEYKALINILRGKFDRVKFFIERIDKIGNGEKYKDTIYLNLAIHKKDFEVFRDELNDRGVSQDIIDENELKFLFHTYKFIEGIEFFEKHRKGIWSEESLTLVAKMYVCQSKLDEGKAILDSISLNDENIKLWLTIIDVELIWRKYLYVTDFVENENLELLINKFLRINAQELNEWEALYLDVNLVRLYLFFDINKAESLILKLRERCNDLKINILYIDILEQLKKFDLAEEIYDEIMISIDTTDVVSDFIYRGILLKYNLKKYDEVVKLYENYIDYEDKIGDCTYFYGKSLIELYGRVRAKELLKLKLNEENNFNLLLLAELNIHDRRAADKYLKVLSKKVEINNDINLYIADIYRRMDSDVKSAFSILKEGAKNKESFFCELVKLAATTKANSEFNKVVINLFLLNYKESVNEFINEYFYNLFAEKKEVRNTFLIAKKMYNNDTKNKVWINRFLESKIVRKDYNNIELLINEIKETENSHYLINVATGYYHLKMFELCVEWSFRAYYYMNEMNKDFILIRLGQIGLSLQQNFNRLNFNFQPGGDFVIILEDEWKNQKIYCFNRQNIYKDFKKESNVHFKGVDDDLYLDLFDKEIGDNIILEMGEFKILDKVSKYLYVFKQGIQSLFDISEKITISEGDNENEIQPFIDMLKSKENSQNEILECYLKGEIPFNVLCSSLEYAPQYIYSMFFGTNRYIYAGEFSIENAGKKKVVLSLRSIFILYFNNLLQVVVENYEIIIGKKIIELLKRVLCDLYSEISKNIKRVGTINGKLFMDKETKESKMKEIQTYKEIINILKGVEVKEIEIENSSLIEFSEVIFSDVEIESIELAKNEQAIICLEDNFLSKILKHVYIDINFATVGNLLVLLSLQKNEEAIKGIKLFIKEKYKYTFTLTSLIKFIFNWSITSEEDEQTFQSIINLLIIYDDNGYYRNCLKYIINNIESNVLVYQISERKIRILKKVIKIGLLPSCFTEIMVK